MTRDQQHPDAPPSDLVRRRLARDVRHEVAELRTRLTEVQLRAEVYLSSGYPGEASRTLEEQHELLDGFRSRLSSVLSDAAVEREAERVIAATADAAQFAGAETALTSVDEAPAVTHGDPAVTDDVVVEFPAARSRLGRIADRLPAAMSAAAAGVVALALVVVSVTSNQADAPQVAIDGVPSPAVEPGAGSALDGELASRLSAGATGADPRLARLRFERALLARQQADPEVDWLIRRQRELLARLSDGSAGAAVGSLLELETLVKQLLAGATDVELEQLQEWLRIEVERAKQQAERETDGTDQQPPIGEEEPSEEPADEPTSEPSEEPSEQPSEDEDGLFDPVDEDGDGNPDDPSTEPSEEPSEQPSDGDDGESSGATPPNPTQPSDQDGDDERQQDDSLLGGGGS